MSDTIGNFPQVTNDCLGCGEPLQLVNAWMTDGCPCNTPLGVNNPNETRWRLLMELQQSGAKEVAKLKAEKAELLELVKVLEWRPLLPVSGSSNFCCICKGQEDSGHKFGCPVDVIRKKMEGE